MKLDFKWKFYQWLMTKLSQKFLIPNWLFPSHVAANAGIPILKDEWADFLEFVFESDMDDMISDRIDQLYILFEERNI